MEPDEVDILALPVLGDLQQIDEAQESRFACQLGSDLLKADLLNRIDLNFAFFHPVPFARRNAGTLPDPDAASNLSPVDAVAETLGERHERQSTRRGSSERRRFLPSLNENTRNLCYSIRMTLRRVALPPTLFLLAALFVTKPAFGDIIYDFQTAAGATEIQFSEPALLSSVTTVSSFTIATSGIGSILSVTLDPVASGSCPDVAGPCYEIAFSIGNGWDTFAPFTTTGTYIGAIAGSTLTISDTSTPEPGTFLLLAPSLAIVAIGFRKRLPQFRKTARKT